MSRSARSIKNGEFYHVMLRGIGHLDIFYDNEDFMQFTKTITRYKTEMKIRIDAYCLMSNHVHILLKCNTQEMALFLKKVEVSYSFYFNHKYAHVGHLFQNRYKSEPVNDEHYYFSVLKYILLNPQNAGICSWQYYKWSSASDYLNCSSLTDTDVLLDIIGGVNAFKEYMNGNEYITEDVAEPPTETSMLSDHQALLKVLEALQSDSPFALQEMERSKRNKLIVSLKKLGISSRQLERITGINRNTIQRAK